VKEKEECPRGNPMRKGKIQYHWQLEVYKMSVTAAMKIFEISKNFPIEEKYFHPVKYE